MSDMDYLFKFLFGMWVIIFILFIVVGIPLIVYDGVYITPIVDEKANQHCQEKGYDFYEKYSRIGFLSKEPVAIICKYVEQYRNIDLNINKEAQKK